jgi:hypothetical protein
MSGNCEERLRLFVEYQNLMQAYGEAIGRLTVKYISEAERKHRSEAANKARQASVEARELLDRHNAEHGC